MQPLCERNEFQWESKERRRQRAQDANLPNSAITDLYKAFQTLDVASMRTLVAQGTRDIQVAQVDIEGKQFGMTVLAMAKQELNGITWGSDREEKLQQIVRLLS